MDLAALLNQLDREGAELALASCCASRAWVTKMLELRPFASSDAVLLAAAEIWANLSRDDMLEAFAGHPQIGEDLPALRERFAMTASWSSEEQAGVTDASDAILEDLRRANLEYRDRFGYIFIVCATGKSAEEMLAIMRARLPNDPEHELAVAAAEQAKITRLRLQKLSSPSKERL